MSSFIRGEGSDLSGGSLWAVGSGADVEASDPSAGIPALAEYVHSKGMLLGWYSAMGTGTCEGFPGLNCTSAGDPCDQARRDVSRTTIAA